MQADRQSVHDPSADVVLRISGYFKRGSEILKVMGGHLRQT